MDSWNRLDKLKPKAMTSAVKPEQGQALSLNAQGNIMQDALYNLNETLQKSNDERNTSANLSISHFKGEKIVI